MQEYIEKIYPIYRDIRQQIHAHPELRYEEFQTGKLVIEQLKQLGLKVQAPIGKTGVVAVLDTGKAGKTIALRADMDGLPILEETDLPYRSTQTGKMHACGHDGHVATLLATAHVLCHFKDELKGKVKFIFQPAEEGGAGAKAMIEEGVLNDPKVDVIFAYHNYPGEEVGQVLAKHGCTMYGNTEFVLEVHAKGGHAAQPEKVINPITIGSEIVLAIQDLMQQLKNDDEPSVISVTQFHSGNTTNVVWDNATLVGTIRSASDQKSEYVQKALIEKIKTIEKQYQVNIQVNFNKIYPATINTAEETDFVLAQARQVLGEKQVKLKEDSARASEDFSFFLEEVPGCYFFIGNGKQSPLCHNNRYDFNDEIIKVGAKLLSTLTINYLKDNQ